MDKKKHIKIIVLFLGLFIFYFLLNGAYSIYRERKGDSIDLSVIDPNASYVVTLDANGGAFNPDDGTGRITVNRNHNQPLGSVQTPTRADYVFDGWWTGVSSGTQVDENTLITGNDTYYAHWLKIICKKASTLHSETCDSTGSCANSGGGYSANDTIYYGNIPVSDSPHIGDAYDCDVNDDDVWDSLTERFYYVRNYGATDPNETSVLVHFTSFDANGQMDSGKTRGSYLYNEALTYLPTSSSWDNPGLNSINGNVTRFISREDVEAACGSKTGGTKFATCRFFLENSRYQNENLGRAGIWLLAEGNDLYRIQTSSLSVLNVDNTSNNTARPVIEMSSKRIEDFTPIQKFRIDLNAKGGTCSESYIEKYYGQQIGQLPIPTKADNTFGGWYTDDQNYTTQVTENTVVTASGTIYAKWIPNITISFDANGGSVSPSSKDIATGAAIGEMPIPQYAGHLFEGWFTDRDNGTEVTVNTVFNSATTIFAHWSLQSDNLEYVFRIPGECTFTANGITNGSNGNCISTINPTGSNIDYTVSPLAGMKYIDTGVALYNTTNHDKDYEIGFTIVSYTSSGQVYRATFMNTKAEITDTYPGVTFRRHNSTTDLLLQSRETASSNAEELFADNSVTSVKVYRTGDSIYYSINGGVKTLLNSLNQYNPIFDLTTWFGAAPLDDTATSATRFLKGTLSDLYIKLESEETATVTFDLNYEGASTTTRTVTKGAPIGDLGEAPTRSGYTFAGWFTDPTGGTQITSSTVVNGDTPYYAHWNQDVTLTLMPVGGQISTNTVTVPYGSTFGSLSIPTPEKTGYVLTGWYREADYQTLVTSDTVITSSFAIYAKWEEAVRITFNANNGTVDPPYKDIVKNDPVGELPTPTRTGYTFEGWYGDSQLTTHVTEQTVFASDSTIFANWIENKTVTFVTDGGQSSVSTKTVPIGSPIGELPTATKSGCTFDGWYLESTFDTLVTPSTIVTAATDYMYAKWININYVAEVGGTQYETLAEAIEAVPTTGVKTTVTLLKAITVDSTMTIAPNQNIEFDLGSYTITNATTLMFENSGTLHIKNGNLLSNGTEVNGAYVIENMRYAILNISGGLLKATGTNVIQNSGTLNITGGKIEANNQSAAINNNQYGVLNMSAGQVIATGTSKGQAIYNNKGTATISGTAYLENVSQASGNTARACLHNNSGTVTVTGGTIVSKANAAVKNNDVMTIGIDDGTIDSTTPILRGSTYGLETVSGKTVVIYDGIFKGKGSTPNKAISNESYVNTGGITLNHSSETIDGDPYDVCTLEVLNANNTVTFNGNGGNVSVTNNPAVYTSTVTTGSTISDIPGATKSNVEFLGWYTSSSGGEKLLSTTVIDDDVTYYAHYSTSMTVCRPATVLHNSGGTDFGQIPTSQTLSAGDAFDCDVNGDGTYDATNERFYYLTNSSDGKAVFIFANNTSQVNDTASAVCNANAVAYGTDGPSTAMGELPTSAQWPNVSLYIEPRDITNEAGTTVVNDYIYTGKAARFATLDEIKAATSTSINGTADELASYPFLLENTAYYGSGCRNTYWLETYNSNNGEYIIDGDTTNGRKLNISTTDAGVRPVIEVPYSLVDGAINIVEFDTIPAAMRNYFNNVGTWNSGQDDTNYSSFNSAMTTNLNNYNCKYYQGDNVGTEYGNVYCDQPNKYDTGVTGNIDVYEYDEVNDQIGNSPVSYVFNDNGKLYNFIPGKTYYWESASDSTKNGYVKPTGERRLITIPGTNRMTRNVRDLGGLPVDTDGDGVIDGKTKFAKLYRGEKIWGTNRNGVTRGQFEDLGIYNELDLRTQGSEIVSSEEDQLATYIPNEIIHYKIDHTEFGGASTEPQFNGKSYYQLARDAAIDVMQRVVAGNNDYALYFHCRIGADRTGTLAYILEGVLGVPTEYRHQDYELTTFFGLRERTRYYLNKDSNNYKFIYLKKAIRHATLNNNENTGEENVMDWFLLEGNTTSSCNDISALITAFRTKMIDYN